MDAHRVTCAVISLVEDPSQDEIQGTACHDEQAICRMLNLLQW